MARVPSVYVFFFFDVVFVNEYVCLNIDALICEHIKWSQHFFFFTDWCMRNYLVLIPVQYFLKIFHKP